MHILANDKSTQLTSVIDDAEALWVSSGDLMEATGFELKPEGACLGDLCVPISQDSDNELYRGIDGVGWINVSMLADKLNQPYVADREEGVWSFGEIPAVRASTLESAVAPDFEIVDRNGATIRLSDYRGKKVLLVTWASW
mgnify:CR=1 FL=1